MKALLGTLLINALRYNKQILVGIVTAIIAAIITVAVTISLNFSKETGVKDAQYKLLKEFVESVEQNEKQLEVDLRAGLKQNSKEDQQAAYKAIQAHQEADNIIHAEFTRTITNMVNVFTDQSYKQDQQILSKVEEIQKQLNEQHTLIRQLHSVRADKASLPVFPEPTFQPTDTTLKLTLINK